MLAQAETDAADIRTGKRRFDSGYAKRIESDDQNGNARIEPTIDLPSLVDASMTQAAADAARTEINTSRAIIFAEEVLAGDPQQPPDRSIEDDWLFTWRDYAGRVSNDDLQRLWGRVLAGEIKSPGTYSLRTLEFLRGLSKVEAEQIANLARFAIEGRIARSQKKHLEEQGIPFSRLLEMQELGVLSGVEAVGLLTQYKTLATGSFVRVLRSNGKALVVKHEDPSKTLELEVYMLTGIGAQILGLGSFEPDLQYLRLLGKHIATKGFTVSLCDWLQLSETEGRYFNEEKLDA